jgi:hypothetical protein
VTAVDDGGETWGLEAVSKVSRTFAYFYLGAHILAILLYLNSYDLY